jgi:hypothetical protein
MPPAPDAPQGPQDGSEAAPVPAPPSPQATPAPSQPPVGNAIASTAGKLVGANAAAIVPFLRQNGQSLDAIHQNWCAAFVNGVLGANGVDGVQGPGKNIATSFLNWGTPAEGDLQAGDVLVQPRGHPAGGIGGHVGIATGHISEGNGQTYVLMQSGNLNGRVAYSWEPAQSLVVRRAPQPSQQAPQ